jgi:F-type H+-transporting ATPase subunit a
MPHGETWFSWLPFHDRLLELARLFSKPVSDDGLSWYMHEPINLQHVYGALLVLIILTLIGIITYGSLKKSQGDLLPPDKLTTRNFAEILVGVVYSQMAGIMGAKAARYFLPLIGTCAFFILISNTMGLVPGFIPPTSKFNTTFGCGLIIFFATHIYGVKAHGPSYFKHFLGPIISWKALPLMILMCFIEMVSHFARPLSLGIRLMANMTADHMVVAAFLALVPFIVPVPMMILGCLVVVIQTLVFCLLSTVYISMAIEESEEGHE